MALMTKALRLVRTIPASPERVFEAWTTQAQVARWTCPDPGASVDVEIDLRVGGHYRMNVDGFTTYGTYARSIRRIGWSTPGAGRRKSTQ